MHFSVHVYWYKQGKADLSDTTHRMYSLLILPFNRTLAARLANFVNNLVHARLFAYKLGNSLSLSLSLSLSGNIPLILTKGWSIFMYFQIRKESRKPIGRKLKKSSQKKKQMSREKSVAITVLIMIGNTYFNTSKQYRPTAICFGCKIYDIVIIYYFCLKHIL